jgi:rubredoxin
MGKSYYTYNGLKLRRISDWKAQGIILGNFNSWDELYKWFINTERCEACGLKFEKGRGTKTGQKKIGKCLDHNHNTKLPRQILCRSCNTMDRYINVLASKFLMDLNNF